MKCTLKAAALIDISFTASGGSIANFRGAGAQKLPKTENEINWIDTWSASL